MIGKSTGLALALAVAATVPAAAGDVPAWTVDQGKSHISFVGRQMNAPSKGEFKKFTAKIRFDPADLAGSAVEVTIDTESASTGNTNIDAELRRPNWFAVAKFPTARFVATSIRSKGGNAYAAAGKLTIRDVTRDVVMPFTLIIGDDPAAADRLLARARGTLTIRRLHFGIGQNEWKDTSVVADKVVIRFDLTARRKK